MPSPEEQADAIELVREIRTWPEKAFDALTIPKRLLKWWGSPDQWWLTKAEVDLRLGGEFRFEWENPRRETGHMRGIYLVIEPGARLVTTWLSPKHRSREEKVEILFEKMGETARLSLRHTGLAGRPEAADDYRHAWVLILGWLEDSLTGKRGPYYEPSRGDRR